MLPVKDKRVGWIAELKVGDIVVVRGGCFGNIATEILHITKITLGGRIICGGSWFSATGREIGDGLANRRYFLDTRKNPDFGKDERR